MVFDQQLFQLFNVCRHAGSGKVIKNPMEFHTKGFAAIITVSCPNGHTYSWDSQPMIGSMFAANLIVASAVFLTGNSFTSFLELCDVIQLQSLKERQFYNIQSGYIIPHIQKAWEEHNTAILCGLSDEPVTVAGDAWHGSPGHCATFGTYSLLDTKSNLIVAQETVKVTEVDNSYWLEIEGLQHCLAAVEDHGVQISTAATDRHDGIGKLMREHYGRIDHEYDMWHVAKGMKKKLSKKGN